jgi:hypothetical protein
MDKYLLWHQLSLFEELNCVCDTLAKSAVTTAMIKGYYNRSTQLLPKEDVAVIIWGNKVTDNISHSIRFHASKEVARKYLGNQKNKSWPNDRFGKIDWEHLDLVLKTKPNMYKIWRSKQNMGFCRTGVQVGLYSGTAWLDERCPNCGCRETAAHLLICPNEDRTQLLIKNTDKLGKWLERYNITDLELSYWLTKYILMRGDKPFAEIGAMLPHKKVLAVSQDVIGYHNFMEGYISTHFYKIENSHLVMSSCYLNRSNWTKQFISKLLHIANF